MNKLSELFNVNHFIVCQGKIRLSISLVYMERFKLMLIQLIFCSFLYYVVNPHVVPFLQENLIPSPVSRLARWFLFLAISELQHRMNQVSIIFILLNFDFIYFATNIII